MQWCLKYKLRIVKYKVELTLFSYKIEFHQALWKTLRNPQDNIALVAFRVLGKFGGGNRKMLREPQRVSIPYSLIIMSLV